MRAGLAIILDRGTLHLDHLFLRRAFLEFSMGRLEEILLGRIRDKVGEGDPPLVFVDHFQGEQPNSTCQCPWFFCGDVREKPCKTPWNGALCRGNRWE